MRTVVAWRRYACKDNGKQYQSEIDCSFIGTTQFQWSCLLKQNLRNLERKSKK